MSNYGDNNTGKCFQYQLEEMHFVKSDIFHVMFIIYSL